MSRPCGLSRSGVIAGHGGPAFEGGGVCQVFLIDERPSDGGPSLTSLALVLRPVG